MDERFERSFRGPEDAPRQSRRWRLRAVGWGALVVVGFVAAVVLRFDAFTRTLVTVPPTLSALAALVRARSLRRVPREVRIDAQGLRVATEAGIRFHPWVSIGWSTLLLDPVTKHKVLHLFDREGRRLDKLDDSIQGLAALDALLVERLGQREDGVAERVRSGRARRAAVLHGTLALALLALGGLSCSWSLGEVRDGKLLDGPTVRARALVESRHLAPDGRTARLEYRLETPEGSARRNAEMEPGAWTALEGASEVEVSYVPGRPDLSRLVDGEASRRDLFSSPWLGIVAGVAFSLLGLALLVAAGFQWRGLDLDLDSKTRKFSIKPYGTGR